MTAQDKLLQDLSEAHALEGALVQTLTVHLAVTPDGPYRDVLERHLRETRDHAQALEQRLGELGVTRNPFALGLGILEAVVGQAVAFGKAPLDLLRGSGGEEKLLKNAKDEVASEALEIATYDGLEALAEAVGDPRTADLARRHRAQEERAMQQLRELIPSLTEAVVASDVLGIDTYDASATGASDAARAVARTARDKAGSAAEAAEGKAAGAASTARRTAARARSTPRRTATGSGSSGRSPSRSSARGAGLAQRRLSVGRLGARRVERLVGARHRLGRAAAARRRAAGGRARAAPARARAAPARARAAVARARARRRAARRRGAAAARAGPRAERLGLARDGGVRLGRASGPSRGSGGGSASSGGTGTSPTGRRPRAPSTGIRSDMRRRCPGAGGRRPAGRSASGPPCLGRHPGPGSHAPWPTTPAARRATS